MVKGRDMIAISENYEAFRTFITIEKNEIFRVNLNGKYSGYVVPLDAAISIPDDFRIPNIQLSCENLTLDDGPTLDYLHIEPGAEADLDIFEAFVSSFFGELRRAASRNSLVTILMEEFEKWRLFFGAGSLKGSNLGRYIGIFGELYFLRDAVSVLGPSAVSNWWGPFKNRNDFEFDQYVIEVKSTVNLISSSVTVNGINQFQDDYNRRTYLILMKFLPSDEGFTIEEIRDEILSQGVLRSELENRINRLGNIEDILIESRGLKLKFIGGQIYRISEDFPLVKASMLPIEVVSRMSALNYTMALEGLTFNTYSGASDWDFNQ